MERDMKIQNKLGIHARPAALIVKKANEYVSDITVEKDGQKVSAKSIMGILTLVGYQGSTLRVRADGADAQEALDAIEELVNNKFYEE